MVKERGLKITFRIARLLGKYAVLDSVAAGDGISVRSVGVESVRPIVFATRRQSRAIEGFDLLATLGCECQVESGGLFLGLVQAQRRLTF